MHRSSEARRQRRQVVGQLVGVAHLPRERRLRAAQRERLPLERPRAAVRVPIRAPPLPRRAETVVLVAQARAQRRQDANENPGTASLPGASACLYARSHMSHVPVVTGTSGQGEVPGTWIRCKQQRQSWCSREEACHATPRKPVSIPYTQRSESAAAQMETANVKEVCC